MQAAGLNDFQAVGQRPKECHQGVIEILLEDRFNVKFKVSPFGEVS